MFLLKYKIMIQPVWRRKLRKFGNEKVIGLPNEIVESIDSDYVILTVENGRIVIVPET